MEYSADSDIKVNKSIFEKYKPAIIIFLKVAIAAGILYYLITSIDYDQIVIGITNSNFFLIAVVFLLSVINIYLQYYKWHLTCKTVLGENRKSKILTSLFYGFSAGIITPLRLGEYFGRALVFKDKSLLQVTGATLIDKIFPFFFVIFFGSISSVLFIHFNYNVSVYLTLSLFVVLFSLFYILAILVMSERFWNSILFSKVNKSKRLGKIVEKIKVFKRLDKNYLAKMSFVSLMFYFCFIVQYAILVIAFSHNNNFFSYLWAGNLLIFVKTIIPPVSLGELGIRESASVYFLTLMNESASVAFNASIFLFIINLLIPALVGTFLLLKRTDA